MVEKRVQIYRQEMELIAKATANLTSAKAEFEEKGIDSRRVEEMVRMMETKYGPESKHGRFLARTVGQLLVLQDAYLSLLATCPNSVPDGSLGTDGVEAVDPALPRYEDIDRVAAPPEYDG